MITNFTACRGQCAARRRVTSDLDDPSQRLNIREYRKIENSSNLESESEGGTQTRTQWQNSHAARPAPRGAGRNHEKWYEIMADTNNTHIFIIGTRASTVCRQFMYCENY